MLDAMAADHERATGPWQLEWVAIPEAFIATGGALRQARFMLEGLIVDAGRMRRNLDLTGGLIVAGGRDDGAGRAHRPAGRPRHRLRRLPRRARQGLDAAGRSSSALPEVTRHLDANASPSSPTPSTTWAPPRHVVDRALSSLSSRTPRSAIRPRVPQSAARRVRSPGSRIFRFAKFGMTDISRWVAARASTTSDTCCPAYADKSIRHVEALHELRRTPCTR